VGRATLDADTGRLLNLVVVGGLAAVGAGLVVGGYRVLGVRGALTDRTPVPPPEVAA
jgi:hypothetical protein